jgi:NAD(P)-dependent dehydrogenase (short-subunit alcohol dehydrogenase family)
MGDLKGVANYDSVAEFESAGRIIKSCVDSYGSVDILAVPASISSLMKIYEMPPDIFDAMIKVHLYGQFYCSHHAAQHMIKQKWGRIIGFSSTACFGMYSGCHYAAAKAGVTGLLTSIALELAEFNITCNYIFPGGRPGSPSARAAKNNGITSLTPARLPGSAKTV